MRRLAPIFLVLSLAVAAPAAAAARHLGDRPLALGTTGADVKALQRLLARDGFKVTADGQFGPGTRKAVKAFQRAAGVKASGVVNATTLALLRTGGTGGAQAPGTTASSTPTSTSTKTTTTTTAPATAAPATSATTGGASPSGPVPASSTGPAGQATLQNGDAIAPAGAPAAVVAAIAGANRIDTLPYLYGGGHKSFDDTAYDCSGSVSYVLHAAGLLDHTMTSGDLAKWGDPGPGKWMTIYANAGHTWIVVAGLRYDTSRYDTGPSAKQSGPRWRLGPRPTDGFVVRHPAGF